ncbi:MAG: hypothetical protein INR71_05330 [Terriglobus roseus]|nr:hypothetical protein [Terriglobus roseus]
MAEVLAPVQVQQTAPITMLHPSSDPFQNAASPQSHSQSPRSSPMPRTHVYNAQTGSAGYRGSSTPISPYAFQSTPQLRQDNRASSAPVTPSVHATHAISRSGQSNASSISTNASTASTSSSHSFATNQASSKDDLHIPSAASGAPRLDLPPMSSMSLTASTPELTLPSFAPVFEAAPKASPNRYRRTQQRQDSSVSSPATGQAESSSPVTAVVQKDESLLATSAASIAEPPSRPGHTRATSDDLSNPRQGNGEQAKRYRRRSFGSLETGAGASPMTSNITATTTTLSQPVGQQSSSQALSAAGSLATAAGREDARNNGLDADAITTAATRPDAGRRGSYQSTKSSSGKLAARPASPLTKADARPSSPLRTSDSGKRAVNPSPLSRPVAHDAAVPVETPASKTEASTDPEIDGPAPPSPAVQRLAALSDQDMNKGKKSRLRRAFSFGSAAELRKASAQNAHVERERSKLTKEPSEADLKNMEDAAVAAKQEAGGIGNSIYSGQGGVFATSTDNISISSTASSASLMLRKMGKGVKKGARSVKGLFRPKSVIGVPAADGPVTQPSVAQVSMVTVEAERERVNVNADPHERHGGGTGFPHLERNSLDASTAAEAVQAAATAHSAQASMRKSIVGGDAERDEVLRAVRKGILKRTGTANSSGTASPVQGANGEAAASTDVNLPAVPHMADSPASSTPGTPATEHGPTKSGSFSAQMATRPDYFGAHTARPFASQSTRSLPNTPSSGRNIAFNPRIQFHDVWSPTEYDRRGEIATCNRLTPMLAQQIKEELNSFKMVQSAPAVPRFLDCHGC